MDTFIMWVAVFFGVVNTYYAWQRAQKLSTLWEILAQGNPIKVFVWKYDAVLAWALVVFLDLVLFGAKT